MQADAQRLQLAGFALGQRVLTMSWDGQVVASQRHPMLPAEVDIERMLRDIGLAWWPVAAIRGALPEGWHLDQADGQRLLRPGDTPCIRLRYAEATAEDPAGERWIELSNDIEGYALTIESKAQP